MKTEAEYGDEFQAHLMEQYKLLRASVHEATYDRNSHSRFYIGIYSALIGYQFYVVLKILDKELFIEILGASRLLFLSSLAGLIFSHFNLKMLKTYKIAIGVKYELLKQYEYHFPDRTFGNEWELRIKRGADDGAFVPISDILIHVSTAIQSWFVASAILSVLGMLHSYSG